MLATGKMVVAITIVLGAIVMSSWCKAADDDSGKITWLYSQRLDAIEKRLDVVEQRVGIQPAPTVLTSVQSVTQGQYPTNDPLYGSQWWAGAQTPPVVAYTYPVVQSVSSVPQVWGVTTGVGGPVGPVRRILGGRRCGPSGCN